MGRKTLVEIDERLLAAGRQILGTKTIKDTVNGALTELNRRAQARRLMERFESMDGTDLDDAEVMRQAWR